ncbi:MAG TPA: PEP-CTERM sorting domain-containing protein, partial [Pirellulaceae bacterium]
VGITETFLPTDPNVVLNVFNQQPGVFQLTDWADLTVPVRRLRVQKDILLFAGANSAAQVSFVDQTFSQIPEPTTAVLLGLGLVVLAWRKSR